MAVAALQVFHHAKNVLDLFQIIEDGDFSASLGDIEMSAAREAFGTVPRTQDKRGQVWTCICHLNTAQQAYERFILSKTPGNVTFTRSMCEEDANAKRRFVLALKAICYRYLGETRLCDEALALAEKKVEPKEYSFEGPILIGYLLVNAIVFPTIIGEAVYMGVRGIGNGKEEYQVDDDVLERLENILKSN